MTDSNRKLYAIIAEKLQADPSVDQKQLDGYFQDKMAQDSQLAEVLSQSMVQINLGDTTAFQTLVQGGIAYIGPRVQIEDAQLQNLLEQLLQRLRHIGIPHNLPRSGAVKFVGRDEDLKRLHEALQLGQHLAITAIHGMGGIGKTELALQYAQFHQQQGAYPGGICWLRAREQDIATQLVSFAKAALGLNLPGGLELAEQVAYCWRNWPEGKALLVVDDVTNYEAIKPYLPPQETRFRVLLTTRLHLGSSISSFEIRVLSELASLALLKSFHGVADRFERESSPARELCTWLGYLPLGLELVGRYLESKPDLPLTKLQKRLQDKRLTARALCQRKADMTAAHESVAAAFELSWQALDELEQQLAYVVSLFGLAPIPWNLVESCLGGVDEEDLEDAQTGLLNRSLLQRLGKGTYQLHQLIREFFSTKLLDWEGADSLKQSYCQVMVSATQQLSDPPTREQIVEFSPIVLHVAEAASTLQSSLSNDDLTWPFIGLSRFYREQGAYEQAVPWLEQCLEVTRTRFGDEHQAVATSLHDLAVLYDFQGCYSEAEPLFVEALSLRKRLLGDEHPYVATSLNSLAELYELQGRYSEAEPLLVEALSLRRRLLGNEHLDVAQSLNSLAGVYCSQGRFSEPEPLYVEALGLRKRLLGNEHQDVAISLNDLAELYRVQGRYSEAEPLYIEALGLYKRLLGEEHPYIVVSLNNLALLYWSQERYSEAEPLFVEALAMQKRLLGEEHPYVAYILNGLAELYRAQGRYSEAEPLLAEALSLRVRLLGGEHPLVVRSLDSLALLYRSQGRYSEAEPLLVEALSLSRRLLGGEHPLVVRSLDSLALLYRSQERYSEAEPLFVEALAMQKRLLGEEHPDVVARQNR
ncbi:MAG: tetratricopeptide repeat protein [Cyanobacteria bacterium P01_G01_bin.38]